MYIEGVAGKSEVVSPELLIEDTNVLHSLSLEQKDSEVPISWESVLPKELFKDPRLIGFRDLFLHFYDLQAQKKDQTMRLMMDQVLQRFYKQYPREDALELSRFYVFGTVLTEYNERLDRHGNKKTERRNEFDQDGNAQPTMLHTTRVLNRGLVLQNYDISGRPIGKKGVKPTSAMKRYGHDLFEDCSMHAVNEQLEPTEVLIEKDTILEIIRNEFKGGDRVIRSIIGVSKYEVISEEIEEKVVNSPLFECMLGYLPNTEPVGEDCTTIHGRMIPKKKYDDIMKMITSVLRLRLEAYDRFQDTGDLEAYFDEVYDNLLIKSDDVLDNLPTGVSFYAELRARVMATLMRVILLDGSNQMMHHLAMHDKDALFTNLHNRELAQLLSQEEYRRMMNMTMQELIQEHFSIPVLADTGYRISFIDESLNPNSVAQTMLEVEPAQYDRLIKNLSLLSGTDEMRVMARAEHPLVFEQFNGVLQKIIHVLGRRNCMFAVKEVTNDTILPDAKLYLRVVEKQPYLWENVLQEKVSDEPSPEEKLLTPPDDPEYATEAFLNTQLLLFNAEYFRNKGDIVAFLVSEKGVSSCRTIDEVQELAYKKGLNDDEYEWVDIMKEETINWQKPPELPIYYRRKRVKS